MSTSTARTNSGLAEKRITTEARVSRAHGRFLQNPNLFIKRCVHEQVYGRVILAVRSAKYQVRFDNRSKKVCASRILRTERNEASIPQFEVARAPNEPACLEGKN